MRRTIVIFAVVGLLQSSAFASDMAEPLKASSPWNVNFGDDSCRIARTFGTGDTQILMIMDRFGPNQTFKLTLGGKVFRTVSQGQQASIRFGPNEPMQRYDVFSGDLGKGNPAMIVRGSVGFDMPISQIGRSPERGFGITRPKLSPERIAAVKDVSISWGNRKPIVLALGSMGKVFAMSDTCIADLVKSWGLDPVRVATALHPPKPASNPSSWLRSSDYPDGAIMRGLQGIVEFRLNVDEQGMPTACHIQQSSRPAEFDTIVCQALMRRARFAPAIDKDGKPFASFHRSSVVFKLGS